MLSYLITPPSNQPSLPLRTRRRRQCSVYLSKLDIYNFLNHLCFVIPALSSLICPIAIYGCEVWGHVKAEDLEVVHHKFCKFVLGVPNTATKLAVYGELGRAPLEIKRRSAIIKYWLRIVSDWNTPALLKKIYVMQTESSSDWLSCTKQILSSLGFANVWINPTSIYKGPFLAELEQRSRDQYVQTRNSQLLSSTGKLRFCKLFKTTFEREPYLNLPPHLWVPITKLRISCHLLQIETEHYTIPSPVPSSERLCWCCEGKVEDELHFVFNANFMKTYLSGLTYYGSAMIN